MATRLKPVVLDWARGCPSRPSNGLAWHMRHVHDALWYREGELNPTELSFLRILRTVVLKLQDFARTCTMPHNIVAKKLARR